MPAPPPSRVTIALCTFNGAEHLEDQLASYLAQTYENWDLWVSDDGSTDSTRAILHAFAQAHGHTRDIRIIDGPRKGVAANFLSLLCHPDFPRTPCALSDQDDVWLQDKLALGMAEIHGEQPCLYGAQSVHTISDLTSVGRSVGAAPLALKTISFGNALVQNVVSGHSSLLNLAALDLVREAGVPQDIQSHDWWLYLLMTGAGSRVVVSEREVLFYRQHSANAMGAHQGLRASMLRAMRVFGTTYGAWIAGNTAALRRVDTLLTPQARDTLTALENAPKRFAALKRLGVLQRYGIARQNFFGTAILWLAVLLGRC